MSVQFTKVRVPMTEYFIDVFIGGTKEERQIIQKSRYALIDKDVENLSPNECATIDTGAGAVIGSTTRFLISLINLSDTPVLIHELFHLMFHISREIGDFRLSNDSYAWASPMIEQIARDILTAKYEELDAV